MITILRVKEYNQRTTETRRMFLLSVFFETVVAIRNYLEIEWDPKDNRRLIKGTGENPKGSNSQGLGRPTVPACTNGLTSSRRIHSKYSSLTQRQGEGVRCYTTNNKTSLGSGLDLLSELRIEAGTKSPVSNIYRLLLEEDILLAAYKKVSMNKGANTEGVDKETLDGYSMKELRKTIANLKDHSFAFKPSRREYIPKANGKLRPLGIASPRDKIIQQAMVMILEAIYESNVFLDSSHGFRPKRGCHTALKEVSR